MASLTQLMQQLALQTIEAGKPSDVVLGEVITVSPLTIRIEQKETLPAEFFLLTRAVLDHYVDIEVNHVTEPRAGGSGLAEYQSHDHDYKGRKKIMIYNGLRTGEKVILVRRQGGQEFVVWDRVFDHRVSGQWLGGG